MIRIGMRTGQPTRLRTGLAVTAMFAGLQIAQAGVVEAASCKNKAGALGVSRIVEIDVSTGPLYGKISRQRKEPAFLKPKEVVLTFDDGPIPYITKPILDALDKFCTKATFFPVGKMAVAYPKMIKEVLARGHTVGSHTWSHPLHMNRMSLKRARDQIERGFSAIRLAAGKPIAPFFRFPGLNDSRKMLNYLQGRHVGTFTVDVVSDDSFIADPDELVRVTLRRVEQKRGGILLFHDIKRSTAKALPRILAGLKKRGYKIVHMKAKNTFKPLAEFDAKLASFGRKMRKWERSSRLRRLSSKSIVHRLDLMPFYGTIGPGKFATMQRIGPPIMSLSPPLRQRLIAAAIHKVIRQRRAARAQKTVKLER